MTSMRRWIVVLFLLCGRALAAGEAAVPSPHAIDVPKWFSQSFLDLREDTADAAKEGKRLMLYFGQDGCPYCKALMSVNFGERDIVEKTRRHFVAVALNLWGDREVTWIDARRMPEKELARVLAVQYTPTILFFDEKGGVALRLNGYLPPETFRHALDYAAGRLEGRQSFAQYLAERGGAGGAGALIDEPFFEKGTNLASMLKRGKPLAVLFEQKGCRECVELHREGLARPEVRALLAKLSVVQLDLAGQRAIVTPEGSPDREAEWARGLKVSYAPSLVYFDASGREVFRAEGYLRPFHLAATLDYVASGALRAEPSFQRYLQARVDRMRSAGKPVDIWK